ncbi:MAG: hypothetical protein H8K04_13690 [Nitrospira sp.]
MTSSQYACDQQWNAGLEAGFQRWMCGARSARLRCSYRTVKGNRNAVSLQPLETPVGHMAVVADLDGNSGTIYRRKVS